MFKGVLQEVPRTSYHPCKACYKRSGVHGFLVPDVQPFFLPVRRIRATGCFRVFSGFFYGFHKGSIRLLSRPGAWSFQVLGSGFSILQRVQFRFGFGVQVLQLLYGIQGWVLGV